MLGSMKRQLCSFLARVVSSWSPMIYIALSTTTYRVQLSYKRSSSV